MQRSENVQGPIVRGENLRKVYHLRNTRVEALRGVDIDIAPGEFVVIMGPSGCGKSTLLNLLAGLDEPSDGLVYIGGQCLNNLTENERANLRRHKVGFIFQSYDLLPLLTVVQNVEFPLALAGVDGSSRRGEAELLLESVGLGTKGHALIDELSGGQRQRVAIARTLISNPEVIFADEPTGSLDTTTGEGILALLRGAVDDQGATVVMVTHDPRDARVADRIVRLRDGRLWREAAA